MSCIRFAPGNAETLPFADQSFDCIFSITVLEECDADRALAEMVRVAQARRPGGRHRAVDRPAAMVERRRCRRGFATG